MSRAQPSWRATTSLALSIRFPSLLLASLLVLLFVHAVWFSCFEAPTNVNMSVLVFYEFLYLFDEIYIFFFANQLVFFLLQ